MADSFSVDAFCSSAREFALSALEAHHAGNRRRVPIDAGTALEHLAKACLARRSPALLAELKGEAGVTSLIGLLRIEGVGSVPVIRTIGLSEALSRLSRFVKPKASREDLQTLADVRNGVIHAAEDAELDERILTAFVLHADTLLADLDFDRGNFWGGQLGVVDALLKDASDKVAHRVAVRRAAAEATVQRRYAAEGEAVITAVRSLSRSQPLADKQQFCVCPVCDCYGIATGWHNIKWQADEWDGDTGEVTNVYGEVWFNPETFRCRFCDFRLDSEVEVVQAGIPAWELQDADPRDYMPPDDDDDAGYERWREDYWHAGR
jgi:hypothetical protein